MENNDIVITNLKQLIKELTDIYETEGNMETIVIRDGYMYPEIELNVVENTVFIEAYKKNEG